MDLFFYTQATVIDFDKSPWNYYFMPTQWLSHQSSEIRDYISISNRRLLRLGICIFKYSRTDYHMDLFREIYGATKITLKYTFPVWWTNMLLIAIIICRLAYVIWVLPPQLTQTKQWLSINFQAIEKSRWKIDDREFSF